MKIVTVSYLNTKPFIYGLLNSPLAEQLELQLEIPSICAERLLKGEADLGLVPVAVLPELPGAHLVGNYCIGTKGKVETVCLFGEQPMEHWDTVYLDYHSRTSVELTKYLLRHHWGLSPALEPAHPGFEFTLSGRTGGLVIGDRAIELHKMYPYVYDLGEAWVANTGQPFVFAAWVAVKPFREGFLEMFEMALEEGVSRIPDLSYLLPNNHLGFDLNRYFTQSISYQLDSEKLMGLERFLKWMGMSGLPPILKRSSDFVNQS